MYATGTVIDGKYRVDHVLGKGGMGIVVAATHLSLGSTVALKFLRQEMVRHASVVERFLREARACAQLHSEHLCRVSDVGTLEDGVPYIVMELLHGRDLASVLRSRGPLPAAVVADYILQAAEGIAEAHAVGIVHRDLKPGNLFLSQRSNGRPLIKVLDFGVAKAPTTDTDFSLTQTTSVIGSPGYMSPEQLRSSKVVDARSDIWAMGIVMYELLTGKKPFLAESITELAIHVVTDPTPPITVNLPPGFGDIVHRCLEKDPARRYQDVAALAVALAPYAAVGGRDSATDVSRALHKTAIPLPPVAPQEGVVVPTTLRSASGAVEALQPVSRSRGILVGLAIGGLAIGVVGLTLTMRSGSRDTTIQPVGTTMPTAPPTPVPTPAPIAPPVPPPVEVTPPAVAPAPEVPVVLPAVIPAKVIAKPLPKRPPVKKPTLEDLSDIRK